MTELGDLFGSAVDIDTESGMIAVGSPKAGVVYIFHRTGIQAAILSPNLKILKGDFGASVCINTPFKRKDVTVLVGAPGQARAYIFVNDDEKLI